MCFSKRLCQRIDDVCRLLVDSRQGIQRLDLGRTRASGRSQPLGHRLLRLPRPRPQAPPPSCLATYSCGTRLPSNSRLRTSTYSPYAQTPVDTQSPRAVEDTPFRLGPIPVGDIPRGPFRTGPRITPYTRISPPDCRPHPISVHLGGGHRTGGLALGHGGSRPSSWCTTRSGTLPLPLRLPL